MCPNELQRDRLEVIRLAMLEIENRRELSPQMREKGLRALRSAYAREAQKRGT